MRAHLRAVILGALVLAMAGCSGSAATQTSTTTQPASTTTTIVAATTTTAAATTTSTPATTTTAAPPGPTTTTTTTTTTPLPPFPPERTSLEHGGETWAVILAAAEDYGDPALDQATAAATAAGYHTGSTDCDSGVAAAVGMPEGSAVVSVSVYFDTQADAQAALLAFQARGVDGTVATVTTYCLD